MRESLTILRTARALAAAGCEADRETPVDPTGEPLQDDADEVIATDTLQDNNIQADPVR